MTKVLSEAMSGNRVPIINTCSQDVSRIEEIIMTDHTHQTEPTKFVDGAGIRFAYRRFGKSQGVPLVFFQHFTGTMDNWDPAVTDGLARDREVILFNNAGISSSGGETPNPIGSISPNSALVSNPL